MSDEYIRQLRDEISKWRAAHTENLDEITRLTKQLAGLRAFVESMTKEVKPLSNFEPMRVLALPPYLLIKGSQEALAALPPQEKS